MAIHYTGTPGFELQAGERFGEEPNGDISVEREYVGSESGLDSFLSTWPRGTPHPSYPYLYLSSRNWVVSGRDCTVSLTFTGAVNANDSSGGEKVVGRTIAARSQDVEKDGATFVVHYMSPVATVTWISETDVSTGSKSVFSGVEDLPVTIVRAQPQNGDPAIDNPSAHFVEDTDYELITVLDGFQTSPMGSEDGNERWTVNEAWTRVIENITI